MRGCPNSRVFATFKSLLHSDRTLRRELMKKSLLLLVFLLSACDEKPWNNPYPDHERGSNILYTAFTEQPRHLDPAKSYMEDEWALLANIFATPLQYDYLKRPVQVAPFAASGLPKVTYWDEQGRPVAASSEHIAKTIYEITLRDDLYYQNHPMFGLLDPNKQTRKVTADDYIYQIKRLADLKNECPIYTVLQNKIIGFNEFTKVVKKAHEAAPEQHLDLRQFELSGLTKKDDTHYAIHIKGTFPALQYWLTTPFFAPLPEEAEVYYAQPGLMEKNITLDFLPISSGPYQLTENNPHRHMVLERNPHFFDERFPSEGQYYQAKDLSQDRCHVLINLDEKTHCEQEKKALSFANQKMPFIDKVVFSLETESVPFWAKFLQGYYDRSGVAADNFDAVIHIQEDGSLSISDELKQQGIRLHQWVEPNLYYFAFNYRDPVYGGSSERAIKLRQAIAIAFDLEEYLTLFRNGRGLVAQGVVPPGIAGEMPDDFYDAVVYEKIDGRLKRRPIQDAFQLLKEAGYPNGVDEKSGKSLKVYFDTAAAGGPDDQALMDWVRAQFKKLNIELVVRGTTTNVLMQKLDDASIQFFVFGWNMDYPDAENMLGIFAGMNAKVTAQGENLINYMNDDYDALFKEVSNKPQTPARIKAIQAAQNILLKDKVLIAAFYPSNIALMHDWYGPIRSHEFANNTLKYLKVDPVLRADQEKAWNAPWLF